MVADTGIESTGLSVALLLTVIIPSTVPVLLGVHRMVNGMLSNGSTVVDSDATENILLLEDTDETVVAAFPSLTRYMTVESVLHSDFRKAYGWWTTVQSVSLRYKDRTGEMSGRMSENA